MRRPSPMRGGDEGDLLKQLLMLEVLDWIAPTQGEFWFIESHAGVGRRVADMPALDWFAAAVHDRSGRWDSFPLWNAQHKWLASAEYLDSSGVAYQKLNQWTHRGLSVRWLLCHDNAEQSVAFQQDWMHWVDEHQARRKTPHPDPAKQSTKRMYQVIGGGLEAIQEMVYLGSARAPGLAVLSPPHFPNPIQSLLTLIETLLMRRFWILFQVPTSLQDRRSHNGYAFASLYTTFVDGLQQLKIPGIQYKLKSASGQWKSHAEHEYWILGPCGDLNALEEQVWGRLFGLFGHALGRVQTSESIHGLDIAMLPFQQTALQHFESTLPLQLENGLQLTQATTEDIDHVIPLWEQLMDEHATLDEHFRRRPLARLYLRHNFIIQQNQPDYLLLIVRTQRQIIGFLSAQVLRAPLFQEDRVGQIVDVYILPEWRSQGAGEALVEAASTWFKALNIHQIDLNVAVHNLRGKDFWERQGFQVYMHVVSKDLE